MLENKLLVSAVLAVPCLIWLIWRHRKRVSSASVIIIFSGKRKSGKDYCADLLMSLLPNAEIGRLSGPLKHKYAEEHGLDYNQLLEATDYKEKYRADMIKWGEERRRKDSGFFASLVLDQARAPILIISDARRHTDVSFFKKHRKCVYVVRVQASDETRTARGWKFTSGIDDAESECGLDDYYPFDFVIQNDTGCELSTQSALRQISLVAMQRVEYL
uniref:Phosphomevalonate kinase n=1 Tax=Aureoumbra lagunensis TaxID=44058 RepID=A0A7S3K354_9STRA